MALRKDEPPDEALKEQSADERASKHLRTFMSERFARRLEFLRWLYRRPDHGGL